MVNNLHKLKLEICDIGRRIYQKGFAAGNDGNISFRLSDKEVLCTPTLICKGFMKPEDLCIVDMEGKQLSGAKKRTSEIMLHLAIMKARPEVRSVVHCHPPHATAFGIAREPIPQCILPEVEIFLGDVPITKYAIPGGQDFADTILPFVSKCNVVILANHGTVSFGENVEKAYWWTEILDAYCRMLMLSRGLGNVNYFTEPEAQDLLKLKEKWGFKDPRIGMQNCDICANDVFRESWKQTGVAPKAFTPPGQQSNGDAAGNGQACGCQTGAAATAAGTSGASSLDVEALVRSITDQVMAQLAKS